MKACTFAPGRVAMDCSDPDGCAVLGCVHQHEKFTSRAQFMEAGLELHQRWEKILDEAGVPRFNGGRNK